MAVNHSWGMRSTSGDDNQFGQMAEVYGNPSMRGTQMYAGQVFGTASIQDSFIGGYPVVCGSPFIGSSVVDEHARIIGHPWVQKSTVKGTAVVTDNATLIGAHVSDNARVMGTARVEYAMVADQAIITGTARVKGLRDSFLVIGGYIFLDRGEWTRAPLHYVCRSGLVVTESADGLVNVNCITNKPEKFLSKACDEYGRRLGMTIEEIQEVQYYVEKIDKERPK